MVGNQQVGRREAGIEHRTQRSGVTARNLQFEHIWHGGELLMALNRHAPRGKLCKRLLKTAVQRALFCYQPGNEHRYVP